MSRLSLLYAYTAPPGKLIWLRRRTGMITALIYNCIVCKCITIRIGLLYALTSSISYWSEMDDGGFSARDENCYYNMLMLSLRQHVFKVPWQ